MSDNIQNLNGMDMFAYAGEAGWHGKGHKAPLEMFKTMTPLEIRAWWSAHGGHDFEVVKVPAIAACNGAEFDHFPPERRFIETEWQMLTRRDNGHIFGPCSKQYQPFQPKAADDFAWSYVDVDPRFQINTVGALGDGERIFTSALFDDGSNSTVAGDAMRRYLLISTSFDATQSTRVEATTTRVVCQNTLRAAHMSAKAVIKTTHRTRFNADQVRRELAQIVASFDEFKRMGDALAQVNATREQTADFFRDLLDIPRDAARKDISTRKQNMFDDLSRATVTTMRERNTNDPDLWCLLNGVTRYVDHDRSVRTDSGARSETAARFDSGTFGAGDALKGKAISLLVPMLPDRDKVLIPA